MTRPVAGGPGRGPVRAEGPWDLSFLRVGALAAGSVTVYAAPPAH